MSVFSKALQLVTGTSSPNDRPLKHLSERQLIELESEIGSRLFGPVPAGSRRDFFCLDENTWIWHEEWTGEDGKRRVSTTRYEVHANGILKAQNGLNYRFIEGEELTNLTLSVRMYYEQIMRGIYRRDPQTGQPLDEAAPDTIRNNE